MSNLTSKTTEGTPTYARVSIVLRVTIEGTGETEEHEVSYWNVNTAGMAPKPLLVALYNEDDWVKVLKVINPSLFASQRAFAMVGNPTLQSKNN